jgi:hypothetical protein
MASLRIKINSEPSQANERGERRRSQPMDDVGRGRRVVVADMGAEARGS